jgi:hypothetical protein
VLSSSFPEAFSILVIAGQIAAFFTLTLWPSRVQRLDRFSPTARKLLNNGDAKTPNGENRTFPRLGLKGWHRLAGGESSCLRIWPF